MSQLVGIVVLVVFVLLCVRHGFMTVVQVMLVVVIGGVVWWTTHNPRSEQTNSEMCSSRPTQAARDACVIDYTYQDMRGAANVRAGRLPWNDGP